MTHDDVLQPVSATAVRAGRRVGQSPGVPPDPAVPPSTYYRWRKPVLRWGQDARLPRERRPPQSPRADHPDFRITRAHKIYGILGWRTSHQRGSSDRASPACKPHASASAWLARAAAIAPCAARWDPASITPARRRTNAADHGLRLLTVKQVADLWQLNEGRVRRMRHASLIRHIRIGRWIRIPNHTLQDDLHALLAAGKPGSSSWPNETWNA